MNNLIKAAKSALERMDRARTILTDNNPRPECNWGMLDTSDLLLAIIAAEQSVGDEREAFEKWLIARQRSLGFGHILRDEEFVPRKEDGTYRNWTFQAAYDAWLARSALPGKVPDGWRFCSADFSLQAAGKSKTGSILLIRDEAGRKLWHAQSDEMKDSDICPPLYVSGEGGPWLV